MAAQPGSPTSDRSELERFVIENDDLLALEEAIGRFNIFDALGIARAEVRHSNFLAWLLDPAESHGQGDVFLRAVLMDILKQAPVSQRPFSPLDLDGVELGHVDIRREWRNVDLLIVSQKPPFVIAIENKVDSEEHSDQLLRYRTVVGEELPHLSSGFVYLTRDGRAPTDDRWITWSYADLHRVLARVRRTNERSIGPDVLTFLDHYLSLIGSAFMDDPAIAELCARIAKNHRRALELIWQHQRSPQTDLLRAIEQDLGSDPGWIVTRRRKSFVNAAPARWPDLLPRVCSARGNEPWEWLVLSFGVFDDTSLYVELYIGPTSDPAPRNRLIDAVEADTQLGVRNRRKQGIRDNLWRVLFSRQCAKWGEDGPDVASCVAAVRRTLDEFGPYLSRLTDVLAGLREQR